MSSDLGQPQEHVFGVNVGNAGFVQSSFFTVQTQEHVASSNSGVSGVDLQKSAFLLQEHVQFFSSK